MRRLASITHRILSSVVESPAALRSSAAVVWRCPLRTLRSLFVLVTGAVVVAACGDDSGPTVVEEGLVAALEDHSAQKLFEIFDWASGTS